MNAIKFGWRVPAFPVDQSRGQTFVKQITDTLDLVHDQFDSAWVADHFIPWAEFESDDTDTLECLATLSYLMAAYPGLDFGAIVLCQSYRNPALLAKMSATLQLLSGGRYIMGIGAGWKEDEYQAYNYPFPRPAVRIAQMSETVQIMRQMWTESPATFEGKHYQIKNAYCEPRPEKPIPIMIGGGGEKLTLRVVAQHADWWNAPTSDVDGFKHKLNVLKGHCEAVGRDINEIILTAGGVVALRQTEADAQAIAQASPFSTNTIGTPEQVTEQLRAYTDVGVTHFILRFADFPQQAGVQLFIEQVLPEFR